MIKKKKEKKERLSGSGEEVTVAVLSATHAAVPVAAPEEFLSARLQAQPW